MLAPSAVHAMLRVTSNTGANMANVGARPKATATRFKSFAKGIACSNVPSSYRHIAVL